MRAVEGYWQPRRAKALSFLALLDMTEVVP